ncbi:HET domain-containing protein [Pleurostoma richardsiae]|uniref:HET domain-containing protein n=1 Tax=Pleurostoma richardsiae TaxID=41990 RepID=A0AA38RMG6_9PEZI|nr:HET domain-containing protein [Pleurostoma richardsiae]
MRLLDVESRELEEFVDETVVPPYAILSHRWEDDEVLFQDLARGTAAHKKGYQKLYNFCLVAQKEGFLYAWIDTCCIDKSSSAELSEAINSMFRWYQQADTCFAYLNDCSYEVVSQSGSTQFQESKWFTRGWTLQELLAPMDVVFLSVEWREFGTRRGLCQEISDITKINKRVLLHPKGLNEFCVAQKLSWAATRETAKPEDRAYSLMGLFGVHMPLLYGEGDRAFLRLQLEILQQSNDQSILAWRCDDGMHFRLASSLLARSPDDFKGCHDMKHTTRPRYIDGDMAQTGFVSGTAKLPQEVVGPYIKINALSIDIGPANESSFLSASAPTFIDFCL